MTDPSQARLLEAWRAGDGAAFARLVQVHQSPLLRQARALLGPGSAHEDVVQEAFLKLAQSPPQLPREVLGSPRLEHAQLAAWLHRVTRNLCMDVMRAESRRKDRERAVASVEADEAAARRMDAADTRALVAERLARLPVDQRDVLVLRLLGERSYREIAEITGKKVGTVGWLVSVGLAALSAELRPLFEGIPAREGGREVAGSGNGLGVL